MFKMNRIVSLIKLVLKRPNFITNLQVGVAEPEYKCPSCGVKVRMGGLCALCYLDNYGHDAD